MVTYQTHPRQNLMDASKFWCAANIKKKSCAKTSLTPPDFSVRLTHKKNPIFLFPSLITPSSLLPCHVSIQSEAAADAAQLHQECSPALSNSAWLVGDLERELQAKHQGRHTTWVCRPR